MASGTMTDTDFKQLKQWLGVMKDAATATRSSAEKRYVTQYSRAKGLPEGQARFELGLEQAAPSAAAPRSGKIRVSNGKESYLIDQNDLEAAQKDGFKPL
jgi:hypothetical protein